MNMEIRTELQNPDSIYPNQRSRRKRKGIQCRKERKEKDLIAAGDEMRKNAMQRLRKKMKKVIIKLTVKQSMLHQRRRKVARRKIV